MPAPGRRGWILRSCCGPLLQCFLVKARTKQFFLPRNPPGCKLGTDIGFGDMKLPQPAARVIPIHSGIQKEGLTVYAMVKFGVVGYGYWGPNIVRNLSQLEEVE